MNKEKSRKVGYSDNFNFCIFIINPQITLTGKLQLKLIYFQIRQSITWNYNAAANRQFCVLYHYGSDSKLLWTCSF